MEWALLVNRHIVRVMNNKSLVFWNGNESEKALTIFRNLFNSNPYDNLGPRFYILALLEGLSYDTYTEQYESDEYPNEIFEWLSNKRGKYTNEFKALEEFN